VILGFVDGKISKLRFVKQWIQHIKGLGGSGYGASNGGDVTMMTIALFSFGTNGDSEKL